MVCLWSEGGREGVGGGEIESEEKKKEAKGIDLILHIYIKSTSDINKHKGSRSKRLKHKGRPGCC